MYMYTCRRVRQGERGGQVRGWEVEEMERDDEGNAVVSTLTSNGLQLCRDNRVRIASLPLLQ